MKKSSITLWFYFKEVKMLLIDIALKHLMYWTMHMLIFYDHSYSTRETMLEFSFFQFQLIDISLFGLLLSMYRKYIVCLFHAWC